MTDNFIEVYDNALTSEQCLELIMQGEKLIGEGHEGVRYNNDKGRIDYNIFLGDYDRFKHIREDIKSNLHHYMSQYADKYEIGYRKEDLDDGMKLQRSDAGEGFFTWHTEQGHGDYNRGRYAVWMYYLNDVTKGGHTEFKHYNLSFQPKEGTLVIWPASYTHLHRAAPDLKEQKYILTGWFSYKEQLP